MTTIFRIETFLLALGFLVYVVRTVNKKKLQMRFSVVWILVALGLMVMALFPGLVFWITELAGMETPANFLYLCAIFLLLVLCFSHTVQLSRQAEQIKALTQQLAIRDHLREEAEWKK